MRHKIISLANIIQSFLVTNIIKLFTLSRKLLYVMNCIMNYMYLWILIIRVWNNEDRAEFLSFINNFQIPKYWCDFFENKMPLGLMATLLIIYLSVQPDCHYCKLIYNSLDGTVPIFICAMFEINRNEWNSQNPRSIYHKKKLHVYEQGVNYSGPHIWNKQPLSCKYPKLTNLSRDLWQNILIIQA